MEHCSYKPTTISTLFTTAGRILLGSPVVAAAQYPRAVVLAVKKFNVQLQVEFSKWLLTFAARVRDWEFATRWPAVGFWVSSDANYAFGLLTVRHSNDTGGVFVSVCSLLISCLHIFIGCCEFSGRLKGSGRRFSVASVRPIYDEGEPLSRHAPVLLGKGRDDPLSRRIAYGRRWWIR